MGGCQRWYSSFSKFFRDRFFHCGMTIMEKVKPSSHNFPRLHSGYGAVRVVWIKEVPIVQRV